MSATWTIILGVLASIGLLFVSVMFKVFAHLASEEVEGRLDQIGYAVLRLACKRLPDELRENYYQEWAAELDTHFLGATERPLTRLYWSLRFPGPLLFRAGSFARIQDPAAFRNVPNPLVQLIRGSRRFRISTAAIVVTSSGGVSMWTVFLSSESSLVWTVVILILDVLLAGVTVWYVLLEGAIAVATREGRVPKWAPHMVAAAMMTALRHKRIGAPR